MSERMFEVNVPGPSGQLPLACTWSNGQDALESMRAFVALGYTPFALTRASGITERLDIGQMEEIFADQLEVES